MCARLPAGSRNSRVRHPAGVRYRVGGGDPRRQQDRARPARRRDRRWHGLRERCTAGPQRADACRAAGPQPRAYAARPAPRGGHAAAGPAVPAGDPAQCRAPYRAVDGRAHRPHRGGRGDRPGRAGRARAALAPAARRGVPARVLRRPGAPLPGAVPRPEPAPRHQPGEAGRAAPGVRRHDDRRQFLAAVRRRVPRTARQRGVGRGAAAAGAGLPGGLRDRRGRLRARRRRPAHRAGVRGTANARAARARLGGLRLLRDPRGFRVAGAGHAFGLGGPGFRQAAARALRCLRHDRPVPAQRRRVVARGRAPVRGDRRPDHRDARQAARRTRRRARADLHLRGRGAGCDRDPVPLREWRLVIPDVLASRYASADLVALWSPEEKVRAERRLWLVVLRAQGAAPEVLAAYERALDRVDLASIAARERVARHDVKARVEEVNALAGYGHIHKGMASRDLTENVEQVAIRDSLLLVRSRVVAALARLAARAVEYDEMVMVGRTHNVPAQATTLGKRFASAAEELLIGYERLDELIARYPLRGIKGPVGTSADQLSLGVDVAALDSVVARHLGFERVLDSVGQVYPRSLDFDVLSALVQVAAGPSSLATTIRLMAGQELATEGFKPGQVGSSAMPHKMNTRSCERINGLAVVLRGYLSMVGELAGNQWNEGDVSCSVVRRVALPDAFFALDGIFQTFLTVLDEFGAYPAVIVREMDRYLPFLATTKILVTAVQRGAGRGAGPG